MSLKKSATFEIIAGTYEEYLLGYFYKKEDDSLTQSFAAHDHSASVRSLATSGFYVASGAADDRIIIYDLKTRKEQCMLSQHEATVNCLEFTNNHSHLLSGSSDGVLAIFKVGSWQLEKIWAKAHKGEAILDIAVHSSGKLALTLGADRILRTWNLVKGRQAYAVNLNSKCKEPRSIEKIHWAPDGIHFILYGGKYIEIWSIETGASIKLFEQPEKVTSILWLTNEKLLVGHEDGQIATIETTTENKEFFQAHKGRVKAVATRDNFIVTASSSGELKVWNESFDELAKHDTGCRLTCLCLVDVPTKKEVSSEENVTEIQEESPVKASKFATTTERVVVEVEESDEEIQVKKKRGKRVAFQGEQSGNKKKKRNKKNV